MKHSIILKFLAFLLAALSILAAVGSAAGIVAIESADLYVVGLDALQGHAYNSIARDVAHTYASYYAADNLGDMPYQMMENRYADPTSRSDAEHWYATLALDGQVVASEGIPSYQYAYTKEFTIEPIYITASLDDPNETKPTPETTIPEDSSTVPETTPPTMVEPPEDPIPDNFLYSSEETILLGGRLETYYLNYYRAPEYTITVCLREEVLNSSSLYLLNDIYPHRYSFLAILGLSLFAAAVCLVYLIATAGCCADGSIRPGGLNRISLDLYTLLAAGGIISLWLLLQQLLEWTNSEGPHMGNLSLTGVVILGLAAIAIAYIVAFSAQIKAGKGYWWRHSILGWCCGLIAAGFRLLSRLLAAVSRVIPVIWQWLLLELALIAGMTLTLVLSMNQPSLWSLFAACVAGAIGIALYGGYCIAILMKGAAKMSAGDLGAKIDTRHLRGSFLVFGQQLNALSEATKEAARKQMRSERMKSELITNVSHDIKTPLTSIINFVDLLQKPHSEAQQQEYLDVLKRQSGQMKKLIEDLMELSKASSGNITANLEPMDAVEAVHQALGEFSDKLELAGLTPVVSHPDGPMTMIADGRLSWRVISNLLSNAVKYAMPGTRLYVDLVQVENAVLLSLKNISKESLNMDPEELLERFVQGDASRKTEGSGLGLNIAKTLMEVQGGKLRLMLDGDLFKVTLVFPAAPAEGENS